MSRFGVARSTVRAAIAQLRAEGMVVVEKGAGSFVRDPGQDRCRIDARVVGTWLQEANTGGGTGERRFRIPGPEPRVSREAVGEAMAQRLGVEAGVPVLRQQLVGPGPGIARRRTTASLHPDVEREARIRERDLGGDDLVAVLRTKGVALDAMEDVVAARMPSPGEREELGILDGVPVLDVVRTIGAGGRTAAVIETVVAADLVSLRYSLPPV